MTYTLMQTHMSLLNRIVHTRIMLEAWNRGTVNGQLLPPSRLAAERHHRYVTVGGWSMSSTHTRKPNPSSFLQNGKRQTQRDRDHFPSSTRLDSRSLRIKYALDAGVRARA